MSYPKYSAAGMIVAGDWDAITRNVLNRGGGATAVVGFNTNLSGRVNYWFCDGVADDVQMNLATAYVAALGGGSVELERGAFNNVATVNVPLDVSLFGQGVDTQINYDAGGNCITITGDNVKLRDFKVVIVAGAGGAGTRPNCIYGTARTNVEITRLWLYGDQTVADDTSDERQNGIVFWENMAYSKIAFCTIQNFERNGISLYAGAGDEIEHIEIEGNVCYNNLDDGIRTYYGRYCTLTGNTCQGNGGNGIHVDVLSICNVITGNTCQGNGAAGISTGNSDNCTISGNICQGSTLGGGHGIHLGLSDYCTVVGNVCEGMLGVLGSGIHVDGSSNSTIVGNNGYNNAGDGLWMEGDADNNLIHSNMFNDNAAYGINLSAGTCDGNWVKDNQLRGNATAPFNDAGTGTKLATKTFQFIAGGDVEGTAIWASFVSATASAKGWSVAGADDWAVALSQLPLELQQIVRFKIWAVALGAPINAGGQMHLEIVMNAGADNLAFTTEPVALANFDGETTDYVNTDVVHWVVDSGDDADIGSMVGGMSIEVKVIYETGSDPDGATNAVFRAVEVEYV